MRARSSGLSISGGAGSRYQHVYDVQVLEHGACPGVPLDLIQNTVPNPSVQGDRMPGPILVTNTRGIPSAAEGVEDLLDSQWIDPRLVG